MSKISSKKQCQKLTEYIPIMNIKNHKIYDNISTHKMSSTLNEKQCHKLTDNSSIENLQLKNNINYTSTQKMSDSLDTTIANTNKIKSIKDCFICEYCNTIFNRKYNLERHVIKFCKLYSKQDKFVLLQ